MSTHTDKDSVFCILITTMIFAHNRNQSAHSNCNYLSPITVITVYF